MFSPLKNHSPLRHYLSDGRPRGIHSASSVRGPPDASEYVVVGPGGPGDRHGPGVAVGKPARGVDFRSPRDDHLAERLPEVLRQKRVEDRVQARVGVRQTMADDL